MKTFSQFITESQSETIVLSFGRFNPPHRGHKLLFDTMVHTAQKNHCESILYINPKQSVPKNPLSVTDKAKYIKAMSPRLDVKWDTAVKDPEEIMEKVSAKYKHLILVEGEDRRADMHRLIDPLIKNGTLKFDTWAFVSSGDRQGDTQWSATQQREAATNNDFNAFLHKGLPNGFPERLAREMFDKTRHGMGIHEGEYELCGVMVAEDDSDWSAGKFDE